MVIIRPEDDTKEAVETIPEEHESSDVDKLKRQGLTEELIKVLEEYQDVFAKDLPAGVPPVTKRS